jgi:hypothetical protein
VTLTLADAIRDRWFPPPLPPDRATPAAFATAYSRGQWLPAPHLALMEQACLQAIENGRRVILSVSVRHGKTDYVRWFMAWYLATHPDARVILASHEADFAARGGRAVRDVLIEHGQLFGVSVSKRSEAANRWDLERPNQGGMLTVGVGGSPIGRGADLLVVDDPVKNYAEAMSPLIRQRVQEWWTGTMVSRIEPGGAVILIMARWHEDDLAGFLLREAPDEWTELRLPAIADDPDDLLGRDIGEALWPERYPLDELERRHKETALLLGEAVWLAQFQQTPRAPEGGMFPEARWGWLSTIHISRSARPRTRTRTAARSNCRRTRVRPGRIRRSSWPGCWRGSMCGRVPRPGRRRCGRRAWRRSSRQGTCCCSRTGRGMVRSCRSWPGFHGRHTMTKLTPRRPRSTRWLG